ncbi:NAD-binding protein, partial [Streptomyces sp. UMAF16]|nr:NAD-binding protein [Streptomyces sp. UMAF16]
MVVCGDDGLAHRLAAELRGVYEEQVILVVPPDRRIARPPVVGRARAASAALFDRMVSAAVGTVGRTGPPGQPAGPAAAQRADGERVLEADEPIEAVLAEAGVARAAALALVYDDDETNIRAALTARRLNPRLRLVLRLYNRRLGQHIEELLDQAAALAAGDGAPGPDSGMEASTTVLSDADTAAPA